MIRRSVKFIHSTFFVQGFGFGNIFTSAKMQIYFLSLLNVSRFTDEKLAKLNSTTTTLFRACLVCAVVRMCKSSFASVTLAYVRKDFALKKVFSYC